jgi:hypothetical protein
LRSVPGLSQRRDRPPSQALNANAGSVDCGSATLAIASAFTLF